MNLLFFPWYGGKSRMIMSILSCIPPHVTAWYEACMGSAVVTLNSPRYEVELLSDLDEDLVHLFSVMANRVDGANLLDRLLHLEYSESEFVRAKRAKDDHFRNVNDIRRAVMEFSLISMSFNSTRRSFRRHGMSQRDYADRNARNLPLVFQRLQGVHIKQMDCVDVVDRVRNNPAAFIFLDVPYRWPVRAKGARNIYGFEMDESHHRRLLNVCKGAKSCIMLCGYYQEPDLYDQVLEVGKPESPWRRYVLGGFVKSCQTKAKRDIAVETIWVNFPLPSYARYYINTKNDGTNPATSLWTPEHKSGIITATPKGGVVV